MDLERNWRIGSDEHWASTLRAVLSADNLTDEALFDAYGLPGPGRLILLRAAASVVATRTKGARLWLSPGRAPFVLPSSLRRSAAAAVPRMIGPR